MELCAALVACAQRPKCLCAFAITAMFCAFFAAPTAFAITAMFCAFFSPWTQYIRGRLGTLRILEQVGSMALEILKPSNAF